MGHKCNHGSKNQSWLKESVVAPGSNHTLCIFVRANILLHRAELYLSRTPRKEISLAITHRKCRPTLEI
eukprot:scaffold213417_cov13-Tisochrysis_lutea.AAC.1